MTIYPRILLFLFLHLLPYSLAAQNDSANTLTIQNIHIEGNIRTKEYIILRELQLNKGDTLLIVDFEKKIKKSTENLQNTSLFNFVTITYDTVMQQTPLIINLRIKLVERWYIWPFFSLKTAENNFNSWWQDRNMKHLTYNLFLVDFNFRGAREELHLRAKAGFDKSLALIYYIPYVNKKQTMGLMFDVTWTENHEVISSVKDYKSVFYRLDVAPIVQNTTIAISYFFRPAFRLSEQFTIEYQKYHFGDSVLVVNQNFSPSKDFYYLRLYSKFKVDFRDNKSYPLNGYYWDLIASHSGFGIFANESISASFLQSNLRIFKTISNRWHAAIGINGFTSTRSGKTEFLAHEIGNQNSEMRGFEYYSIPIHHFVMIKNNLKLTICKKRTAKLPFIKSEKIGLIHYAIYLNAFFDAALLDEDLNRNTFMRVTPMDSRLIYSSGLGLDFVTYYDLVFRFETTRNFLFNEWGFFVNLKASI